MLAIAQARSYCRNHSFSLALPALLSPSGFVVRQKRNLSLHEHQAQDLLREAGAGVARGFVAETPDEVERIASQIGPRCVLKSQILSGGRGKGRFDSGLEGGIQLVDSPSKAGVLARKMLGHRLITKQTKKDGILVRKLYVVEVVDHKEEYYLAITIDRAACSLVLMASKQGGMNVEKGAGDQPSSLIQLPINYTEGITPDIISQVKERLDLADANSSKLGDTLRALLRVFRENDATLLEINPLTRTIDGEFICLDSKLSIDDESAHRHPQLFSMRDKSRDDQMEIEAEKHGLVYVRLDGDVGLIVNGAGLAMATNDAISFYGGHSANFLDTGGQATNSTIKKALEIVLGDSRVKVILVNIYGGIIRCDMIAASIIEAAAEFKGFRVPVVVRLQGTNAEEGQRMIAKSELGLISESEFGDAAQRAVQEAKGDA